MTRDIKTINVNETTKIIISEYIKGSKHMFMAYQYDTSQPIYNQTKQLCTSSKLHLLENKLTKLLKG